MEKILRVFAASKTSQVVALAFLSSIVCDIFQESFFDAIPRFLGKKWPCSQEVSAKPLLDAWICLFDAWKTSKKILPDDGFHSDLPWYNPQKITGKTHPRPVFLVAIRAGPPYRE